MSENSQIIPISKLSSTEINKIRMMRWRARTDLGFLCREVLNYPDVSDTIHGPIFNVLQKFPTPNKEQFLENDKPSYNSWLYKPIQRHTSLPGGRRALILDPRGWLKTTINAQSHTIQWLLNYPDISIMIVQSNLDKAEMILGEIKKHFQYNPMFRQLFPEHCPSRKVDDFGTKGKFTTIARGGSITRKEESVITSSIDAGSSGIHVDVIKYSDIVEPSNTGTPEQMENVTKGFYMSQNLLVGPNYWIDVEGTRYDFGDTYGRIIESEKDLPLDKKTWKIHARGCYKKNLTGVENFTPEELLLPDAKDTAGNFVPHWVDVERGLTPEHFEAKRREDPYIFSCQQLNAPAGGLDGKAIFPLEEGKYPTFITRKDYKQNVRVAYYIASVDTAETKNERSNYTAITVAAISNDGRTYINEIIHGKFLPDETVDLICDLVNPLRKGFKYGNNLREIHLEDIGFTRGLMVALNGYQQRTGIYLPIKTIKRDNQIAKIERIQNTLQVPYMNKRLIFLDDIKHWDKVEKELREFPRGQNDDILDSLADLFQGRDWHGREVPRLNEQQAHSYALHKFLGVENVFDNYSPEAPPNKQNSYYDKTGGM